MKIIECQQYSPEWWEARRGIPTASAFDRIITPGGKLSAQADDYIAELIGDRVCLTPNFLTERPVSRAMANGTDCEPQARSWYELEHAEVQQVGFVVTDDLRFGCSPDGLVGSDGLLELKCPTLKTQVKYLLAGPVLPPEYKPQVHGQLFVTGRAWVDFVSYAPGLDKLLVRVFPDRYTTELKVALEVFYEKYREAWERIAGKGGAS